MPHLGLETFAPYVLYFGGIAAFFGSFRRPWIGLYLLTLTMPLQTIRAQMYSFPFGNKFIDVALLGVLIGVLRADGLAGLKTPMTGFLLVLSFLYYISLWQGGFYLGGPLPWAIGDPRFSNWKNYVEMFLFCMVAAGAIKDKEQAKWLLVTMAVSVLLVNKGYYSAMSDRALGHFSYEVRYAGTLGYAGENGLGSFEAMMAAFFIGIAAYVKRPWLKFGLLFLIATCIYCVLFSFSRESYVGLLAAIILVGLLRDRKLLIAVAVVLITWETVLPQAVQERIAMTSEDTGWGGQQLDASSQTRVTLWQDALAMATEAPVFGIGFNTYEYLGRVEEYSDTHNYYVKVLLETGVVGLMLFLWLLARLWRQGFLLFRRALEPFWASVGLGFLALICTATVVNFFGDRWTYQQLDGFLWILLGLVVRGLIITQEQYNQADEGDNEETLPVSDEMPRGVLTA